MKAVLARSAVSVPLILGGMGAAHASLFQLYNQAAAGGAINFTWDPAAAGIGTTTAVTASNMILSDYATITVGSLSPSSYSETGYALVAELENSTGVAQDSSHLNQANGYSLYFYYTATGTQSAAVPAPGTTITGTITGLTFTMYGVKDGAGGQPSFTFDSSPPHTTNINFSAGSGAPVKLATGSIVPDENGSISVTASAGPTVQYSASAMNIATTLDPVLSSFFVNPLDAQMFIQGSLTVSQGKLINTADGYLEKKGGGGNFDIVSVPEPSSLALFGVGLGAAGLIAARRRKVRA